MKRTVRLVPQSAHLSGPEREHLHALGLGRVTLTTGA